MILSDHFGKIDPNNAITKAPLSGRYHVPNAEGEVDIYVYTPQNEKHTIRKSINKTIPT
jgi:hypothetical protein